MLNEQVFYLYGQIQTSQAGGQSNSDTSRYCECSLHSGSICTAILQTEEYSIYAPNRQNFGERINSLFNFLQCSKNLKYST